MHSDVSDPNSTITSGFFAFENNSILNSSNQAEITYDKRLLNFFSYQDSSYPAVGKNSGQSHYFYRQHDSLPLINTSLSPTRNIANSLEDHGFDFYQQISNFSQDSSARLSKANEALFLSIESPKLKSVCIAAPDATDSDRSDDQNQSDKQKPYSFTSPPLTIFECNKKSKNEDNDCDAHDKLDNYQSSETLSLPPNMFKSDDLFNYQPQQPPTAGSLDYASSPYNGSPISFSAFNDSNVDCNSSTIPYSPKNGEGPFIKMEEASIALDKNSSDHLINHASLFTSSSPSQLFSSIQRAPSSATNLASLHDAVNASHSEQLETSHMSSNYSRIPDSLEGSNHGTNESRLPKTISSENDVITSNESKLSNEIRLPLTQTVNLPMAHQVHLKTKSTSSVSSTSSHSPCSYNIILKHSFDSDHLLDKKENISPSNHSSSSSNNDDYFHPKDIDQVQHSSSTSKELNLTNLAPPETLQDYFGDADLESLINEQINGNENNLSYSDNSIKNDLAISNYVELNYKSLTQPQNLDAMNIRLVDGHNASNDTLSMTSYLLHGQAKYPNTLNSMETQYGYNQLILPPSRHNDIGESSFLPLTHSMFNSQILDCDRSPLNSNSSIVSITNDDCFMPKSPTSGFFFLHASHLSTPEKLTQEHLVIPKKSSPRAGTCSKSASISTICKRLVSKDAHQGTAAKMEQAQDTYSNSQSSLYLHSPHSLIPDQYQFPIPQSPSQYSNLHPLSPCLIPSNIPTSALPQQQTMSPLPLPDKSSPATANHTIQPHSKLSSNSPINIRRPKIAINLIPKVTPSKQSSLPHHNPNGNSPSPYDDVHPNTLPSPIKPQVETKGHTFWNNIQPIPEVTNTIPPAMAFLDSSNLMGKKSTIPRHHLMAYHPTSPTVFQNVHYPSTSHIKSDTLSPITADSLVLKLPKPLVRHVLATNPKSDLSDNKTTNCQTSINEFDKTVKWLDQKRKNDCHSTELEKQALSPKRKGYAKTNGVTDNSTGQGEKQITDSFTSPTTSYPRAISAKSRTKPSLSTSSTTPVRKLARLKSNSKKQSALSDGSGLSSILVELFNHSSESSQNNNTSTSEPGYILSSTSNHPSKSQHRNPDKMTLMNSKNKMGHPSYIYGLSQSSPSYGQGGEHLRPKRPCLPSINVSCPNSCPSLKSSSCSPYSFPNSTENEENGSHSNSNGYYQDPSSVINETSPRQSHMDHLSLPDPSVYHTSLQHTHFYSPHESSSSPQVHSPFSLMNTGQLQGCSDGLHSSEPGLNSKNQQDLLPPNQFHSRGSDSSPIYLDSTKSTTNIFSPLSHCNHYSNNVSLNSQSTTSLQDQVLPTAPILSYAADSNNPFQIIDLTPIGSIPNSRYNYNHHGDPHLPEPSNLQTLPNYMADEPSTLGTNTDNNQNFRANPSTKIVANKESNHFSPIHFVPSVYQNIATKTEPYTNLTLQLDKPSYFSPPHLNDSTTLLSQPTESHPYYKSKKFPNFHHQSVSSNYQYIPHYQLSQSLLQSPQNMNKLPFVYHPTLSSSSSPPSLRFNLSSPQSGCTVHPHESAPIAYTQNIVKIPPSPSFCSPVSTHLTNSSFHNSSLSTPVTTYKVKGGKLPKFSSVKTLDNHSISSLQQRENRTMQHLNQFQYLDSSQSQQAADLAKKVSHPRSPDTSQSDGYAEHDSTFCLDRHTNYPANSISTNPPSVFNNHPISSSIQPSVHHYYFPPLCPPHTATPNQPPSTPSSYMRPHPSVARNPSQSHSPRINQNEDTFFNTSFNCSPHRSSSQHIASSNMQSPPDSNIINSTSANDSFSKDLPQFSNNDSQSRIPALLPMNSTIFNPQSSTSSSVYLAPSNIGVNSKRIDQEYTSPGLVNNDHGYYGFSYLCDPSNSKNSYNHQLLDNHPFIHYPSQFNDLSNSNYSNISHEQSQSYSWNSSAESNNTNHVDNNHYMNYQLMENAPLKYLKNSMHYPSSCSSIGDSVTENNQHQIANLQQAEKQRQDDESLNTNLTYTTLNPRVFIQPHSAYPGQRSQQYYWFGSPTMLQNTSTNPPSSKNDANINLTCALPPVPLSVSFSNGHLPSAASPLSFSGSSDNPNWAKEEAKTTPSNSFINSNCSWPNLQHPNYPNTQHSGNGYLLNSTKYEQNEPIQILKYESLPHRNDNAELKPIISSTPSSESIKNITSSISDTKSLQDDHCRKNASRKRKESKIV